MSASGAPTCSQLSAGDSRPSVRPGAASASALPSASGLPGCEGRRHSCERWHSKQRCCPHPRSQRRLLLWHSSVSPHTSQALGTAHWLRQSMWQQAAHPASKGIPFHPPTYAHPNIIGRMEKGDSAQQKQTNMHDVFAGVLMMSHSKTQLLTRVNCSMCKRKQQTRTRKSNKFRI